MPQSERTAPSAPSAPRATTPVAAAAVVNPVQAWAEVVNNLFALQRQTWANIAGIQRPDNN